MTPKQRKQLAAILLKEGEEGWVVEKKGDFTVGWVALDGATHVIDCERYKYRAVGPRKRVGLKRGMEVTNTDGQTCLIVRITSGEYPFTAVWDDGETTENNGNHFAHYRWPNLETDWLPIDGEPEIISMEGVE